MGQQTEKLSLMVEPFVITFSCLGMSVPLTNFQALRTSATNNMDKGTVISTLQSRKDNTTFSFSNLRIDFGPVLYSTGV